MKTVIEIRQDTCVIQIYENANLSEMSVTKFRKLLKMAANKCWNDPEKIRKEIIETLERERRLRETQIHGDCVCYNNSDIKYFQSCLKKIEKMKSEVQKYV